MSLFRIRCLIVFLSILALPLVAPTARGQTFVAGPAIVSQSQHLPNPNLAATSAGHAIVAWCGIPNGVKASHSTDWGTSWSTATPVTGNAPFSINVSPAIAADAGGHAIIAWPGVHLVRSTDHGQNWSPPNLLTPGSSPAIATDGMGTWIIVFLDQPVGSPDSDVFYAWSTDGGLSWAISQLNSDASYDDLEDDPPKIATDGAGNWITLWTRHLSPGARGLLLTRSTDDGVTWSSPEIVATWGITPGAPLPGLQDYVLSCRGDRWLIAASYYDDIYVYRSDDLGLSWSPAHPLTGTPSEIDIAPSMATDRRGSWLVAWQSKPVGTWPFNVHISRSGDNGASWSAGSALNASPAFAVGNNLSPAITTDRSGNWMVAWGCAFSSNFQDILVSRGVGPSPTSSLTLTLSNPTPTSYLIDVAAVGFTPGNDYFTCFSWTPGEHPAGPWFGIDPLYDELAAQAATLAPPFNGTFDAAGAWAYSWTLGGTPGPLGVTLYAVTVEHISGNILRASPPISPSL